jgi:hypothetical protein
MNSKEPYVVSPDRSEYVPGERFYPAKPDKPKPRPVRYGVGTFTDGGCGLAFTTDREIDCLDFIPPTSQFLKFYVIRFEADGTDTKLWVWKKSRWVRCSSSS